MPPTADELAIRELLKLAHLVRKKHPGVVVAVAGGLHRAPGQAAAARALAADGVELLDEGLVEGSARRSPAGGGAARARGRGRHRPGPRFDRAGAPHPDRRRAGGRASRPAPPAPARRPRLPLRGGATPSSRPPPSCPASSWPARRPDRAHPRGDPRRRGRRRGGCSPPWWPASGGPSSRWPPPSTRRPAAPAGPACRPAPSTPSPATPRPANRPRPGPLPGLRHLRRRLPDRRRRGPPLRPRRGGGRVPRPPRRRRGRDAVTAEPKASTAEPGASMAEPRIIAFLCRWCAGAAADQAGRARLPLPHSLLTVEVPCSGRVEPAFVLQAFREGADGVLIAGLPPRGLPLRGRQPEGPRPPRAPLPGPRPGRPRARAAPAPLGRRQRGGAARGGGAGDDRRPCAGSVPSTCRGGPWR